MAPRKKAAAPIPAPSTGKALAPSPGVAGLRRAIASALEEGLTAKSLLLRLSRRDLAMLKRSPEVAVNEIRFAGESMHFLGIRVAEEPAEVSHLDRGKAAAIKTPEAVPAA